MGRDATKRRKKDVGSEASSVCVEILNKMADTRDSMDKDDDEYKAAKMDVMRDKMQVLREQTDPTHTA